MVNATAIMTLQVVTVQIKYVLTLALIKEFVILGIVNVFAI